MVLARFAAFFAAVTMAGVLSAADYPARPIRLVVPFAPGGGSDVVGRIIGLKLQYVQSNRLRPLVVTSTKRSAALPNVPTLVELGYDVVVTNWYGVVAPAGTPQPVVQRLYDEIGRALTQRDTLDRLRGTGLEPVAQSPGHFRQFIAAESTRWAQTVTDARIQTE